MANSRVTDAAIDHNPREVLRIVSSLPVPGPAEEWLRQRGDLEILGAILPPDRYREAVRGAAALLPWAGDRIDEAALEAAGPSLRVVSTYGVGLDHVDIPACTRRGIFVGHTPNVLTDATADLAMTLLLATARRVVEADREVREGRFSGWKPHHLLGQEVTGATLGVIGFGRIGQAVARRAAGGFAMRILAYDVGTVGMVPGVEVDECDMDRLLAESDFVTCHVPLTPETHHLIGTAQLARMRKTAILINTSRGPVIDEAALVDALQRGVIAGAGLDVFENEPRLAPGLAGCAHAVLLPHVGTATWKTRIAMGELAARNILEVLDGRAPIACANPEVSGRV
jgi:glyoxylate reductase